MQRRMLIVRHVQAHYIVEPRHRVLLFMVRTQVHDRPRPFGEHEHDFEQHNGYQQDLVRAAGGYATLVRPLCLARVCLH